MSVRGYSRPFSYLFRRIFACAAWQRCKPMRLFSDVVASSRAVADDYVHHSERERGVGSGLIAMCQSASLAVRVS